MLFARTELCHSKCFAFGHFHRTEDSWFLEQKLISYLCELFFFLFSSWWNNDKIEAFKSTEVAQHSFHYFPISQIFLKACFSKKLKVILQFLVEDVYMPVRVSDQPKILSVLQSNLGILACAALSWISKPILQALFKSWRNPRKVENHSSCSHSLSSMWGKNKTKVTYSKGHR